MPPVRVEPWSGRPDLENAVKATGLRSASETCTLNSGGEDRAQARVVPELLEEELRQRVAVAVVPRVGHAVHDADVHVERQKRTQETRAQVVSVSTRNCPALCLHL